MGWVRAAAKQSPHPPTRRGGTPWMGSSPTLAHASPSWDLDDSSPHPTLQQRTADAQPTNSHREQAFDRLNPNYGVPADPHNPSGHQALRDREAALALGTRVAVAASRENDPTRSCGWPTRTTEPPTPSTGPASRPSASGTARNDSAPNANP